MFRFTLKNYRCFSDSKPAVVEIDRGFTAFIGTNNSGKSSLLRFFHEFRDLFTSLISEGHYRPRQFDLNLKHIEDWTEVFSNHNTRDAALEIEDTSARPNQLAKVRVTFHRKARPNAKMEFWVISHAGTIVKVASGDYRNYIREDGQQIGGATDVKNFVEICTVLSQAFYVGPFRNAISEGGGSYYDMGIGTTFIQQWDEWKNGSVRLDNLAAQQITDDIAHIFDFKHFEINASPDKKAIQVTIERKPHRLRELGAGLAQFIIVFGNVATRRPTLLLIDEPELNLHPSLQIDFLTSLASYASYGVAFASHSVGLARAVSDRIYTFQKQDGVGVVKPFEQTPNFAEFVGEMSFSSFKEVGCDRILLVEGVTEVKAIQQFLRALRKDHTTVLLPLGGSQMIRGGVQNELSELSRLSKNIGVLLDSERQNAGAALSAERQQFVRDCQELGFKVHVTQKRAFENYLSDSALKEEKGDKFNALGEYEKLSDAAYGWAKSDNWRIARRMSRTEILATDVVSFPRQGGHGGFSFSVSPPLSTLSGEAQ